MDPVRLSRAQRAMLAYWRTRAARRPSRLMWMEAQLQAARDPQFRAQFGAFLRERHARAIACIDALADAALLGFLTHTAFGRMRG